MIHSWLTPIAGRRRGWGQRFYLTSLNRRWILDTELLLNVFYNEHEARNSNSSSAYYSESSYNNISSISGNEADNEVEEIEMVENEVEEHVIENQEFEIVETIEQQLNGDVYDGDVYDEDDDEVDSSSDEEYYINYKFYKSLKK